MMKNRLPEETETAPTDVPPQQTGSRRRKLFAVLPTMLTLGNLACGFGAITFAAKVGPTTLYGNELMIASILVYVAMIFDIFDGSAARLTNQTSEFGAQLDSLCDSVSFGVAPAFIMLQFTQHRSETEQKLIEMGLNIEPAFAYSSRFLWVVGAWFVMCAVLRLARFNVETEEDDSHEFFSGLPSPAAAGVIVAVPIAMWGIRDLAEARMFFGRDLAEWLFPIAKLGLPIMALIVACLMVSRVRYPHFFNQLLSGRRSRKHLLQLIIVLVLLAFAHEVVLFFIFAYFAFAAPIVNGWKRLAKRKKDSSNDEPTAETG